MNETNNEVLARRLLDMFSLEELLETMEITEEALVKWLLDENHLNQVTLDELGVKDDGRLSS
jgi:hypothetical protein